MCLSHPGLRETRIFLHVIIDLKINKPGQGGLLLSFSYIGLQSGFLLNEEEESACIIGFYCVQDRFA